MLRLLLTLLVFPALAAAQCAMCKSAVQASDAINFVEGLRSGILLLLVMPYLIVGSIGFAIYRAYRIQKNWQQN